MIIIYCCNQSKIDRMPRHVDFNSCNVFPCSFNYSLFETIRNNGTMLISHKIHSIPVSICKTNKMQSFSILLGTISRYLFAICVAVHLYSVRYYYSYNLTEHKLIFSIHVKSSFEFM